MRQRWFRQILQHRFFIILLLLLQTAVLIVLILNTSLAASWVSGILYFIGIMASLKVVSSREKPTYKLLWVFMILLLPVFGTCLYLLLTCQTSPGRVNQKLEKLSREIHPFLPDGEEEYRTALRLAPGCVSQITYLQQAGFPVCRHTRCTYFPSGEAAFERLCKELKNAGKYIFLEFFIIQEGKMWNTILEILKEKARQGLQVRVIYDDIGCFLTLPKDYPKRLAEYGIECRIF
ncbi:MAG: PLDc N-terminal domain-containing protein, partial [Lachnospiraceae bacterium]|nr:PLDc N-terminal domain-containing protein [Lachnospiraceae bacterium]